MKKNIFALKINLPLAKFEIDGLRLVSNALIFSDDISVDIQLVTFSLLCNFKGLKTGAKTRKF